VIPSTLGCTGAESGAEKVKAKKRKKKKK
jgi:hypothetical protein